MNIKVRGTIPPNSLPSWVGLELTCSNCKTIFDLTEQDLGFVTVFIEKSINGYSYLITHCPVCQKKVEYKESHIVTNHQNRRYL